MKRLSVCALAACAVTAGCGVGAEVRTTDVAARGAVLSADVRAIVAREATVMVPVGARPLSATEAEQLGKMPGTMVPTEFRQETRTIVCAEPSPDAIRAVARELSLALQASAPVAEAAGAPAVQAQAAASAAARSAIASIAQRTPTIQLMRDMLYRVCEGVMNGVLDRSLAQFVTSQIDDLVIGLHAIDGLTGMPGAAAGAVSAAAANEATATVGETAEGKTPSVTLTATSTPATRNQLSDGAAKAIADAVVLIVREVTGRTEGTGNRERRR